MNAYGNIYANEAKEKIDKNPNIVVLDVRTPEEYNRTHIKGSYLIPLTELNFRYSELDPQKEIIVICSTGRRSIEASRFLIQREFVKVYNVIGGIALWPYTDMKTAED